MLICISQFPPKNSYPEIFLVPSKTKTDNNIPSIARHDKNKNIKRLKNQCYPIHFPILAKIIQRGIAYQVPKKPWSEYSPFLRKRKQIKFHRRAKLPAINRTEVRHFLLEPLRDNMSCLQRCNAITMLRSPPRNRRINTIANYGAVHVLISSVRGDRIPYVRDACKGTRASD